MPAALPLYGAQPSRSLGGRFNRLPRCALPAAGAAVVLALAAHLLVDLFGRAAGTGPAGLVSAGVGSLAVSVVLAPFAVLFAARTRSAWRGSTADPRRCERSARSGAI